MFLFGFTFFSFTSDISESEPRLSVFTFLLISFNKFLKVRNLFLLLAPAEHFVVKYIFVVAVPCFMEVVHVQLSDEGGKIIVLEVVRQDFLYKFR